MVLQPDGTTLLIQRAVLLAEAAPIGVLQNFAQVLASGSLEQWAELQIRLAQVVPQQHLRPLVEGFVVAWRQHASGVTPTEAALIIRTAAVTTRTARERQRIELVWTGPTVPQIAMRRTDQALLEVIQQARQSLLIVSFAVYNIPTIATAIVQAAERGVSIQICVEAPEPSRQKMAHDTVKSLGRAVAERSMIYVWPDDQRMQDANGQSGVLHVKCAVCDAQVLFLSSANLTDRAFNRNMELGVLITGGTAPLQISRQFAQLIEAGILRRIQN